MYVYEMDKFRQMLRGKQRVFICMSMRWTSSDRCLKAEQRVFMCLSMRWTSSDRRLEGNKGCLYDAYEMDKSRQILTGKQRVFIRISMRWTSSDRRLEGNKGCLYVCRVETQPQPPSRPMNIHSLEKQTSDAVPKDAPC